MTQTLSFKIERQRRTFAWVHAPQTHPGNTGGDCGDDSDEANDLLTYQWSIVEIPQLSLDLSLRHS